MRSLTLFYFLICFPIAIIILLHRSGKIEADALAFAILIFSFIYHPVISGLRLVKLGVITKRQFWKNFIPAWNSRYFIQLFFYSPRRKPARTDGWSMLRRMAWYTFNGSFAGGFFAVLLNAEWPIIVGGALGMIYYGYNEIKLVWAE